LTPQIAMNSIHGIMPDDVEAIKQNLCWRVFRSSASCTILMMESFAGLI
jgi:hypothetical protein